MNQSETGCVTTVMTAQFVTRILTCAALIGTAGFAAAPSASHAAGPTTSIVGAAGAVGASSSPSISADGRFVAISTTQPLIPSDTDGLADVYVTDRATGAVTLVQPASSVLVNSAPDISDDGARVVFLSRIGGLTALVAADTTAGTFRVVSTDIPPHLTDPAAAHGSAPAEPQISGDGSTIVFTSRSNTIVVGDTNGRRDLFAQAFGGGPYERLSVSSSGVQGSGTGDDAAMHPSVSVNGQAVAFSSAASGLAPVGLGEHVYLRNRTTSTTSAVITAAATDPSLSADARFVALTTTVSLAAGDRNGVNDVYVVDLKSGAVARASTPTTTGAAGASDQPSISPDGSTVAFRSAAANLVAGDSNSLTDIFVRGTTTVRASVATGGVQAQGGSSSAPALANLRTVAFTSDAVNLVVGDSNGASDVFVFID